MATYYDTIDFSRPLHVDCSVEYELPNAAKPPPNAGSEPLLMIHPSFYRRAESQRRSPFINNLPMTTTRPRISHQYPSRYSKRDPMICGMASCDSGVSGLGQWPDVSPLEARLQGPDSGIVEDKCGLTYTGSRWDTVSSEQSVTNRLYGSSRFQPSQDNNRELRDSTNQMHRQNWAVPTTDLLGVSCAEVNNNQHLAKLHHQQPAVAVAAVAPCRTCQPQFLHPQQKPQQPWSGVTAPAVACAPAPTTRQRVCAVEPGPDHAAYPFTGRTQPTRRSAQPAPPAKRSRILPPAGDCPCAVCKTWAYTKSEVTTEKDNTHIFWNKESMMLYQV